MNWSGSEFGKARPISTNSRALSDAKFVCHSWVARIVFVMRSASAMLGAALGGADNRTDLQWAQNLRNF